MKSKILLIVAGVALMAAGVSAQTDCGFVVPCGPIPWRMPQLPALASPTPMPTIAATTYVGNPGAGTPTAIPTATPGFLDTQNLQDQIATLNAVIASTPVPVAGTPVDDSSYQELGANAGTLFGYARGIGDLNLGSLTPMIAFSLLAIVIVLTVKISTLMLPVIMAILGIIRKIVNIILEFIPL